jgi:hypothetical protein
VLDIISARKRLAKAEACAKAEEEHREATNGLIEARRAADAADASANSAYQQAGIAAWGLSAGIVTLAAALGAAIFAERAAYHTKRSVKEMGRIGEAQVRAYITPPKITLRISPNDSIAVKIKVKNLGQSPAENFYWVHRLIISRAPENWREIAEANGSYAFQNMRFTAPNGKMTPVDFGFTIGAGSPYKSSFNILPDAKLTEDELRDLKSTGGKLAVHAIVQMVWKDTFDNPFWREYSHLAMLDDTARDVSIVAKPGGLGDLKTKG